LIGPPLTLEKTKRIPTPLTSPLSDQISSSSILRLGNINTFKDKIEFKHGVIKFREILSESLHKQGHLNDLISKDKFIAFLNEELKEPRLSPGFRSREQGKRIKF
jgi:hypothetical protein